MKIRKYFCRNSGSKTSGKHMYHLLQHKLPLYFLNRVYFCILYGSHNEHRLFS